MFRYLGCAAEGLDLAFGAEGWRSPGVVREKRTPPWSPRSWSDIVDCRSGGNSRFEVYTEIRSCLLPARRDHLGDVGSEFKIFCLVPLILVVMFLWPRES